MANISDPELLSCTTFIPFSTKLIVRLDCLLLFDHNVTRCGSEPSKEEYLATCIANDKKKFSTLRQTTIYHWFPYLGSNCEHDGEIISINNLIDVGTHRLVTLCAVHQWQEIYSFCGNDTKTRYALTMNTSTASVVSFLLPPRRIGDKKNRFFCLVRFE